MDITLTGTAPLMMHNIQLADDMNPFTRGIKAISSKTKKSDEDRLEMSRLEFFGGLYWDDKIGVFMPSENIFRCLMNAAMINRGGKKIERGMIIHGTRFPFHYDGPQTPDELWNGGESPFIDRRAVGVMGKRIMRTRPIFPAWEVTFSVSVDPKQIDDDEFVTYLHNAGKMIGLGDYRRFYGKFTAETSA